jgi:hypothetical protein
MSPERGPKHEVKEDINSQWEAYRKAVVEMGALASEGNDVNAVMEKLGLDHAQAEYLISLQEAHAAAAPEVSEPSNTAVDARGRWGPVDRSVKKEQSATVVVDDPKGRWGKVDRSKSKQADPNSVADRREALPPLDEQPSGEEKDFMQGIEIGRLYPIEVSGEVQDLSYQGDDKDGKAVMLTQKGMRLLKSKGLDEVLKMAEVFPQEFAVSVDKSELREDQIAA